MFPYRDENQTQRRSYVAIGLIAANVLVWIFVQGAGSPMPVRPENANTTVITGVSRSVGLVLAAGAWCR
jgi:hypothetical protein